MPRSPDSPFRKRAGETALRTGMKTLRGKDAEHIVAIYLNLRQQPFNIYRAKDIVWKEFNEHIEWQTLARFPSWGWLEVVGLSGEGKAQLYRIPDAFVERIKAKLSGKKIRRARYGGIW